MADNIMRHWADERGAYDGGIACGEGYTIAWRRRNGVERGAGATVESILLAVLDRLQAGHLGAERQGLALERVAAAIEAIRGREG